MILDIDEVDATDLELLDRYSIPDLCSHATSRRALGPEPPPARARGGGGRRSAGGGEALLLFNFKTVC